MKDRVYKRRFYRIRPGRPLYSYVTIARIGRRRVNSHTLRTRVLDISPGGLRFQSDLRFPRHADMELRFEFAAEGQRLVFCGMIAYRLATDAGFLYGVEFVGKRPDLGRLLQLFNGMSLNTKKHYIVFRFCAN